MKLLLLLLLCTRTLIAIGSPAAKHYLIETDEGALKEDIELLEDAVDKAAMEEVVEKVSEDVIDALEGEKTYEEMIEDGKEDLETVDENLEEKLAKVESMITGPRKLEKEAEKDYMNVYNNGGTMNGDINENSYIGQQSRPQQQYQLQQSQQKYQKPQHQQQQSQQQQQYQQQQQHQQQQDVSIYQ